MDNIVQARALRKVYGDTIAIDNVDLDITPGRIVGVIGPNGAGKTSILKAILGLIPFEGELSVLGLHPHAQRTRLLEDVCFIADTAILPRWMSVKQAIDYMEAVHSRFSREKAQSLIGKTKIRSKNKIGQLSKGMVTQLHLALVMAIDAKLLVLDEPTLGLDIIYRKEFYSNLLGEYFDQEKTIIVTTHQVEEIENILTDVVFIDQGRIIFNELLENIADRYIAVSVDDADISKARALNPMVEQKRLGGASFIFQIDAQTNYAELGKTSIPTIADLFLAKIKGFDKGAEGHDK